MCLVAQQAVSQFEFVIRVKGITGGFGRDSNLKTERWIRFVYIAFGVVIFCVTVLLIITLIEQGVISINTLKENNICGYLTQIAVLYSKMNLTLSLLLLIVTVNNGVAYTLFIKVVRNYFKDSLAEERKQLTIVFSVFFGVVTTVMIVSFTIGTQKTFIKNVTIRRFLENLFTMFTDFPCIFVILYFHHINYRPVKMQKIAQTTEVK